MKILLAISFCLIVGCKNTNPSSTENSEWNLGVYHSNKGIIHEKGGPKTLKLKTAGLAAVQDPLTAPQIDSIVGEYYLDNDTIKYFITGTGFVLVQTIWDVKTDYTIEGKFLGIDFSGGITASHDRAILITSNMIDSTLTK